MSNTKINGLGGNEKIEGASEAIGHLPGNKTLLIEKLTENSPKTPQIIKGLNTVDDVFKNYKPSSKITFKTKKGTNCNRANAHFVKIC